MTNFTGANVITTSDVTKYQPDAFDFGISTTATETTNFLAQTTNEKTGKLEYSASAKEAMDSHGYISLDGKTIYVNQQVFYHFSHLLPLYCLNIFLVGHIQTL